jgi:hypothetical protein
VLWCAGDHFSPDLDSSRSVLVGTTLLRQGGAESLPPELEFPLPVVALKQEKLLKRRVIYYRGLMFTVYDLIDYFAHAVGGVHADGPDTPERQKLLELQYTMRVPLYRAEPMLAQPNSDVSPVAHTIMAIGRVVHRAIQPLQAAIESERT